MESHGFCPQCGEMVPAGASFCGRCGAKIAPRRSSGDGLSAIVHLPSNLTDSDIVYLHGYCFVDKGDWKRGSTVLESTGARVQKGALVNAMLMAALASLTREGWVEVEIVNIGFLLPCNTPIVRGVTWAPFPKGGLEGALVSTLQRQDKLNSLDQIMLRLVGWDRDDPWEELIGRVREHLVEAGYFRKLENPEARGLGGLLHPRFRYEANAALVASSAGEISRVRANMADVLGRSPHVWEKVAKQIDRALKACKARSDSSDD